MAGFVGGTAQQDQIVFELECIENSASGVGEVVDFPNRIFDSHIS